jgi:hypothetical protein
VDLGPRLATIDGICANMVPHAWPARWPNPRSPATSPAGPARRAGPRPADGAAQIPPRWPTRQGGARRSPASRSRAPWQAAGAMGWRCGP